MNSPYREAHQNRAFTPEMAGNLGHVYQQSPRVRDVGMWGYDMFLIPAEGRQDFVRQQNGL